MLVSFEHSQWEVGIRGALQGRDPQENLTLHYSIVKRLQGPIPLLLPLSYLCWNPWHYTTRRPAPDPSRQISESWTNSLRQGGSGETVFPTTVGTLQLIILFQSKHNINLSVFLPILWKEICIGNYLSDVNICKHHSHLLVHMKRKNIIKVPAVVLSLLSGAAQLSHWLSRLQKSSGYSNITHSSLQCQLLSALLFQERAVTLSVIIQKPMIKRSKAVSSCVLFPGGTQWYFWHLV